MFVGLGTHRAWLQAQGVRVAQGYLLSRPLPPDEVTALLAAPGGTPVRG